MTSQAARGSSDKLGSVVYCQLPWQTVFYYYFLSHFSCIRTLYPFCCLSQIMFPFSIAHKQLGLFVGFMKHIYSNAIDVCNAGNLEMKGPMHVMFSY